MGTKRLRLEARKPILRVVPWFSMNELVTVYQLLYSENIEQQKIGLDRMVSWKARCSNLPVGVECSLGIAQVLLEDPEHANQMSVSITREQQLRLVYSSAVMRFLNLILEFKREGDQVGNMYIRAAKLNIPDWIVNLRHDAAHGVALPDLSLLRTAALFIFKWLDEHYWVNEIQTVSDWHVTEAEVLILSAKERELQDMMETWEALSLYSLAGFHQLRLIPDNELMDRIASIHQMLSDNDGGEPGVQLEINQPMVSTALKLVLRRMGRFFKKSSLGKATYMANTLVAGEFFLPSPSLMKILYPDGYDSESVLHQLPQALSNSCKDLLFNLWNFGAIPDLVLKLISVSCDANESDLRKNMAALWVQKLLLSCLKAREARKVFSAIEDSQDLEQSLSHYKDLHPNLTRRSIILSLAFSAVDNQRPDLKEGYTWDTPTQIPASLTGLHVVKQCFLQPSKFSSLFLPSLMEFTSPPIPLTTRTHLSNLLELFFNDEVENTNADSEENAESQTFSANDLPCGSSPGIESDSTNNQRKSIDPEEKSHWTLSQGGLEWCKFPLGVLPWQREQDHLDQEECDGKQQQRTWPKLLMTGAWTKKTLSENLDGPNTPANETAALRRIKDGRVKKPYAKQTPAKIFTPVKVLKSGRFSQSPQQKAIDVLKSL